MNGGIANASASRLKFAYAPQLSVANHEHLIKKIKLGE